MTRYLLKRFGYMLLSFLIIISLTFFLMKLAPGGPFTSEENMPKEIEEALNETYGLNDPWYKQYSSYLGSIAKWDLGTSFKSRGQSINDIINRSFPISLLLGFEAILIALGFGVLLGVIGALRHNKAPDYVAMSIAIFGISVPSFILATVLQYVFALKLGWFPVARFESFSHSILPAIALSLMPMAFIARLMRSSMLEVMNQDYVKMAKAKGMQGRVVVFRHLLRNAIMPVVSFLGPLVVQILTGSFIIENIFGIPGLGFEYLTSITNRDYTAIMGITAFFSILLLVSILLVDILYGFIDPRIKVGKKEAH